MEQGNGNMTPLGAYESQEARQAQPVNAMSPAQAPMLENAESTASTEAENDTEMRDAAQATNQAADASMDQEEKRGDECEQAAMVVNLKFLHRERVTITCPPTILVAELKQRVRDAFIQAIQQDSTESQASQQLEAQSATQPLRLIYKGKVLKDDTTLQSYNFISDETIHAVFSRPAHAPTSSNAAAGEAANTNPPPQPPAANGPGGDAGSSVLMFESASGSVPDISQFINSIVNSAMNTSDRAGTTATIEIFPITPPNARSGGESAAVSPVSSGPTHPSPAAAPASRSASVAPSVSQRGSVTTDTTRPAASPRLAPSATPVVTTTGPALLLNQAAALRRSIPGLELTPLSRPQDLSPEMYALGNAMRESGDTYLAIHRQLQFLATRFLQENHLSSIERDRLRTRVQHLIPVLEQVGQLSTSASIQLANSSYGPTRVATPLASQTRDPAAPSPAGPTGIALTPPPTTTGPIAPPSADAFADFMRMVTGNQPSANATLAIQAVNAIPSALSFFSALAGIPPSGAAAGSSNTHNQDSTQTATRSVAAANTTSSGGPTTVHAERMLFRSLGPQMNQIWNANPHLAEATIADFLRVAMAAIDRQIVTSYAAGSDAFIQTGVDEVENALRLFDAAHQRVYAVHESRRSIVRLAMQELAQICLPMATSLEARCNYFESWIRRSCSHLFAELCEVATARDAVQMTSMVVMQLLSGNSENFTYQRSPFLERVASETRRLLERRLQFS